jgi:hypothetical protein
MILKLRPIGLFAGVIFFIYSTVLNAAGDPIEITEQPEAANICKGSNHTISVTATGSDLTYQWYKDGRAIPGATQSDYEIRNALMSTDYGAYKVIVMGSEGPEVSSKEVRIWIADPISSLLLSIPDTAIVNRNTRLHVGYDYGYTDVYNYAWSFSDPNDDLNNSGLNLYTYNVRFHTPEPRQIVALLVDHVCDTYLSFKQIRVQWPTGIDKTNTSEVNVYPNPAVEELTVKTDGLDIKNMLVTDLNGRIVYRAQGSELNSVLSVRNWPKGIYFVKITTEEGMTTHKIIKD